MSRLSSALNGFARHATIRATRRLIVTVVGGTVLAAGVALLVLPGPAFVVIPVGLGILATEFVWARRLLGQVRERIIGQYRAAGPAPGAPAPTSDAPLDAVVMAGARGSEDAFVQATGAAHRALISVAGRPLLAHVLAALGAFPGVGSVRVSIDPAGADLARKALTECGAPLPASWPQSADSPARSALAVLDSGVPFPLLVTTADHALLTPAMLEEFLREAQKREADLVVGVVPKPRVLARYPGTRRTGLRFADVTICGANLFLLRTPASRKAVAFWVRVERDRKRPLRLVRHFGLWTTLCFALRRLRFDRALEIAGARMGLVVDAVRLSEAEAAIDVDNVDDLELAEAIFRSRAS